MIPLLLVMAGGAVGSGARFLTGRLTLALFGPNYLWSGTLAVNIVGGFLMGLLVGVLTRLDVPGDQWRLLLGVGLLGGYTTFSSMALDFVTLLERGDLATGLGYLAVTLVVGILALVAGLSLVRAVG